MNNEPKYTIGEKVIILGTKKVGIITKILENNKYFYYCLDDELNIQYPECILKKFKAKSIHT